MITIEAAPPQATIPPPEPEPPAGGLRERVLDQLRANGPSTVPALATKLGAHDTGVRTLLNKMAGASPPEVRRCGTRPSNGRPATVWEAVTQGPTSREAAHEADAAKRAARYDDGKADADAEAVLDLLREGDYTSAEIKELLGFTTGRANGVLGSLTRRRRLERRGERGGKSLFRRVLLPEEQEDVTIRNGAGAVSRTQVVECLRRGAASLCELADELGVRPADVALIAGPLERSGEATRVADGKYRLLEAAA